MREETLKDDLIEKLEGGLVVSCQAFDHEPLASVDTLVRMAIAAELGGANAIRACWSENISAIKKKVNIPIFGINKIIPKNYNKMEDIIITPTLAAAKAVYYAGADIIAVDCTVRNRTAEDVAKLIRSIKNNLDILVMGEVSTVEEGIQAESYGVDIISTTIAGYTHYSRQIEEPDYQLVKELVKKTRLPINAEGRYKNPTEVKKAFECGAWTVTVGSAITRPHFITKQFIESIK